MAFGIFVALGAIGVVLALVQNARILAYASLIGAFAAPILASTGGGSYTGLLGYYAVLVVAALAIAARKGWFGLGLLALLATYGVGIAYTVENFTPADYLGMQLFVALFFGLFLAATLLFAARGTQHRPVVELVLAVLNPLAVLVWQAAITDHFDKGLGWSLLAGGLIYLLLFGGMVRLARPGLRIQRELSLFWALFLLSLAVPAFFDAQVTGAVWAVAGAVWVWLAQRQAVRWLAPWGLITQVAAGIAFLPATFEALGRALDTRRRARALCRRLHAGLGVAGAGRAGQQLLFCSGWQTIPNVRRALACGSSLLCSRLCGVRRGGSAAASSRRPPSRIPTWSVRCCSS